MPNIARINDMWMGICCCHPPAPCISMGGYIITGSPNSKSGNFKVSRLSDIVIGFCGHTGKIVTSSYNNLTNGMGKARIGDIVTGCNIGHIITGNSIHITL